MRRSLVAGLPPLASDARASRRTTTPRNQPRTTWVQKGALTVKISDINFKDDLVFNPEEGLLSYGSQRMVMFSASALSALTAEIMELGGVAMTQVVMRTFGERAGRDDARVLKEEFSPDTTEDWLGMGPLLHTWEGLVKASITHFDEDPAGVATPRMHGVWENSYFAQLWLDSQGESKKPVCWPLAGYVTGYTSAVYGAENVCREQVCIAQGAARCEFITRAKEAWTLDEHI